MQAAVIEPRRRVAASGAVLLIVGALAWVGLSSAWRDSPVNVNVRWRAALDAVQRTELERRFHLWRGQQDNDTTWSYRLEDPSSANIEQLVRHEAVADTAHLNRVRYRPELSQDGSRQAVAYAVGVACLASLVTFLFLGRRPAGGIGISAGDVMLEQEPDDRHVPDGPEARQTRRRWFVAVVTVALPLVVPICVAVWKTPFPMGETIALLEDVEKAQSGSVWILFDPLLRSWYRPLYHLTWYFVWNGTDTIGRTFAMFKVVEIVPVVALVVMLVRFLRPRTAIDGAAALCAVTVLLGQPGFHDNLEVPMLMTLVGMPLGFGVWMLAERDERWWHVPAIALMTAIAVGFKEQGLVIVPVVVAARWMRSPGVGRTTAVAVVGLTIAYLLVRFTHTGNWHRFEQDVGLGLNEITAGEAERRFGAFPWGIYAYSAVATVGNILFSEPSRGRFVMLSHLLHGELAPWEVNHLLASVATTALIAWWAAGVWRRDWRAREWSRESRLLVATVVAILASGALGFSYTRDRMAGMVVAFYAACAFFAVRAVAVWSLRVPRPSLVVAGLVVLALSWQVRAVGTLEDVRFRSEKVQREWMVGLTSRRADFDGRPRYLAILEAMIPQGRDSGAARRTGYPDWVVSLMGEP